MNGQIEDVKVLINNVIRDACRTEWENESMLIFLQNDGTNDAFVALIPRIIDKIRAKANDGIGSEAHRSR